MPPTQFPFPIAPPPHPSSIFAICLLGIRSDRFVVMGRATSTPEQKKILKRARQQRYRAKKRAMRRDQAAQLCPTDPPTAAVSSGTIKPIRSVDSITSSSPTKQDPHRFKIETRHCLCSYTSTIRIILDPVHSKMAGDLVSSHRCTPDLLAAWLHHQLSTSPDPPSP